MIFRLEVVDSKEANELEYPAIPDELRVPKVDDGQSTANVL